MTTKVHSNRWIASLCLVLLLLAAALTGCTSHRITYYTSPQVTGRVLAANTHEPLANVVVRRGAAGQKFEPFGPPKGGQLISEPLLSTHTDAEGRFTLPYQSAFAVLHQPGWWSIPVAFDCTGYKSFQTNYSGDSVTTHTPEGAPLVDAGDIMLQPSAQ